MIASDHTRLMNMSIGLCYKTTTWPSFLRACGYKLQVVEQDMRTRTQAVVKPDVVVASGKERHALVIECKGGANINKEQEERYAALDARTLSMWVTVKPRLDDHAVLYAVTDGGAPRISGHTDLPLLIFGKLDIRGAGSLDSVCVDKELSSPIPLAGMAEPVEHYPYGVDDGTRVVAQHVLQGLVRLINEKKAVDDLAGDEVVDKIFKINHIHHKMLSADAARQIRAKIKKTIEGHFLADVGVREQLDKIRGGDRSGSAWRRLLAACEKNVERESKQERL